MKIIIALTLSVASLLAADDIPVATSTKTNELYETVTTKEYFMRSGQTNLLRVTSRNSTNGVLKSRSHFFYHDSQRVAVHLSSPAHGYTLTRSAAGFGVDFTSISNVLTEVSLTDKDGNLLDLFVATNGLLTPMPGPELRKYSTKPKGTETDDK